MDTKSIATLARLVQTLERVEGRTRLQKIVHLLSERFPADFRQRFALHYFGPFSRTVESQMDFLVENGLVSEEAPAEGSDAAYCYTIPNDKAAEWITYVFGSVAPAWIEFAKRLNEKDKSTLEAVSTIVFLRRRSYDSPEELRQVFARLKPHLKGKFDSAKRLSEEWIPLHQS